MTNVCWCSLGNPKMLYNVGMEAICIPTNNTISFVDLKTGARSYHRASDPKTGAGISLLCGHNRFALVAFAEAILRPSIFVLKYPELSTYTILESNNVMRYVDMHFSEFDHLIAVTGFPNYRIRIWNFRTSQLLVEQNSYTQSAHRSLHISGTQIPSILQYDQWRKEITIWEILHSADTYQLNEVTKVSIPGENLESQMLHCTHGDERNIYVVNDYGEVSWIEPAQFNFKRIWTPQIKGVARRYAISYNRNKNGLIVYNDEMVYGITRKGAVWTLDWEADISTVHEFGQIGVVKCNFNLNIYAANEFGAIYQIQIQGDDKVGKFVPLSTASYKILEYAILKGLKDELVVLVTSNFDLRVVDLMHMRPYSMLNIPNVTTIKPHNSHGIVAVGTSTGIVHFISFEKPRMPVVLGEVDIGHSIVMVRLQDNATLVSDIYQGLYILQSDFKKKEFAIKECLEKESDGEIVNCFLPDENRALVFATRKLSHHDRFCDELWLYRWQKKVYKVELDLPFRYRKFTLAQVLANKDYVELTGIREFSNIFDIYYVKSDDQVHLISSVQTTHFSYLVGIVGARNLVTWGVDGTMYHFKTHKKSPHPHTICRFIHHSFIPRMAKRCEECFNGKYLLILHTFGSLTCIKLSILSDNLRENTTSFEHAQVLGERDTIVKQDESTDEDEEPSPEEYRARKDLDVQLKNVETAIKTLIEYDISVTGKTQGIFRKFCLNTNWLNMLNEQARTLFEMERKALEDSIEDQTRIRDWIYNLVTKTTTVFSVKLRAIFAHGVVDNYSERKPLEFETKFLKLFHFVDLEPSYDEEETQLAELSRKRKKKHVKRPNIYDIKGSAYDHLMAEHFRMQEIENMTAYRIICDSIRIRPLLNQVLRDEYNKMFSEVQKLKQETVQSIAHTNQTLVKIFDNMNIMLRLLYMNQFTPVKLSMPQFSQDEVIERIMQVDDSEIKAINRRKKLQEVTAFKSGRMLLWAVEFWVRALNVMMDGVLEKLWEEEIKKDVPKPEFMNKKEPHEYSLDEQKAFREYEENVQQLQLDRRKYLGMLRHAAKNTVKEKKNLILKLNAKVSEMIRWKLKYDFAYKHFRLRLLNYKIMHYQRSQWRKRLALYSADFQKIKDYAQKYETLAEFWERGVAETKLKLESLTLRDKTLDRQFKSNYLAIIPQHLTHEMLKLFRKRPKIVMKSFNSTLVCSEVASRITQKGNVRLDFPLPNEILGYIKSWDEMDEVSGNCPNQLDHKYWEQFVKLRRQKIENELKIKGAQIQLLDAQSTLAMFNRNVVSMKEAKNEACDIWEDTKAEYIESVVNQFVEVTLRLGQVEVSFSGSLENLQTCLLMHVEDINAVNNLIKQAGEKKLKAMEKVAFFRRQVIFKEWEHQVVRANIEYLRHMLQVISKTKVTKEFLNILRNWSQLKIVRDRMSAMGALDKVIEQRIAAFQKHIERIDYKIETIQKQIEEVKQSNQAINRKIDQLKVSVAMSNVTRDVMIEDRHAREQKERTNKIIAHHKLMQTIRRDYATILELNTILELQRLRTYPTLGPPPDECYEYANLI